MAQFVKTFYQELNNKTRTIRYCEDVCFTGDNLSDMIGVYLTVDGQPYTGGGTVSGTVINSRGQTIPITTGAISGNLVTVALEQSALAVPGLIGVYVKLITGETVTTVLAAKFTVEQAETDTPIDPGTVISSVDALITRINTAVESIPADYSELLAGVAPSFSSSTPYFVGQYVWYPGLVDNVGALYRFTADHVAGSWTGTDAVSVSLAGDLGAQVTDLKSAVNDISKVGKATYSTLGYHNLNYNLVSGKQYNVNVISATATAAVIIKTPDDQTIDTIYQGQGKTITAASDVPYLKLYFNLNNEITFTIEELGTQIDQLKAEMKETVDSVDDKLYTLPYIQEYNVNNVSKGYINTSGGIVNQIGWFISDYMPIKNGAVAYYDGLVTVGVSPSSAYYDSGKNLISGSVFKQATGKNTLSNIPLDAAYVRFSIIEADKDLFKFFVQQVPSFDDLADVSDAVAENTENIEENTRNIETIDEKLNTIIDQTEQYVEPTNWFDHENATLGTINSTPVLFSPFVAVQENDVFYLSYHLSVSTSLSATSFYTIQFFDDSKTLTGNAGYWVQGVTIPSGVSYVKFVVAQTTAEYIMVEKGTQTLVWSEYFDPYYSAKDVSARQEIDELTEKALYIDEVLQYPANIYGVVGHELNIYYENAIQYGTMDTIAKCDISGTLGSCQRYRDRLIWTPVSDGVTAETISMYKTNLKTADLSKAVSFKAAPANAGSGTVKVLVIGDSKTAYGQPTGYLQDLFDDDGMTLELLGTRWGNNCTDEDTTNRHEGRAAWGAYTYCNAASGSGGTVPNPFYNANYTNPTYGGHFDFSHYMDNQGYSGVDFVFINLGTNDFGGTDYTYWACMMAIITSIQKYATDNNKTVYIIPVLVEGVYADKLEWATRNEAFFGFRQRLLNNVAMTNVYYNPMYLSMDLHNDFPFTEVPLSYADGFVNDGKTRKYCDDGIHQNPAGFYKNAFSMYAILKCIKAGIA